MRIAMSGQTWGPENGPGVFARRLAHGLTARGHEVLSMIPARGLRHEMGRDGGVLLAGIPAVSFAPFYPEVHVTPAPMRSVRKLLGDFRPDLVHVQDHYPLSRAVVGAARAMKLPVVVTNHFIPENMLPHMPLLARLPAAEWLLWKTLIDVLSRADTITTPTETAASILRPHLPQARIRAISCGIDADAFHPPSPEERASARARWSIRADQVVFTYVGRLDREKRIDVIVRALPRARSGAIRLIVAGRGRESEPLRRLAARLGLGDRVTFAGFVRDADLVPLLHASDFFVMPGEAELQSIATLEAMATGLPVLAAEARALPELVRPGINGALFEAGNAEDAARGIAALASDPARWSEMSAASRARALDHSIDSTMTAYEEVYRCLV